MARTTIRKEIRSELRELDDAEQRQVLKLAKALNQEDATSPFDEGHPGVHGVADARQAEQSNGNVPSYGALGETRL